MSGRNNQRHGNPSDNDANLSNWTSPFNLSPPLNVPPDGVSTTPTHHMNLNLNMLPPYTTGPSAQQPGENNNIHGSKVAIPRIAAPNINRGRRRSARACEACRQRKIKCDGAKPACGHCTYQGTPCSYEDVKRVRDQKELKLLGQRVEHYEHLLRSLEGEVEPPTARKIRKSLKFKNGKLPSSHDGEDSDSSVGSLEDIDNVDEDLNRDEGSRAAGFFGKNSEVSWMQRLESQVDRESSGPLSPVTPLLSASSPLAISNMRPSREVSIHMMNYHLDDLAIPPLDDSDPNTVPPRAIADEYFNAYLTFVHPTFPAIRRTTFVAQYRQFYDLASSPPQKWLGILNMIFAIGCWYCQLSKTDPASREDDPVYFARARKLVLDQDILFDHPDLQQTQLELLVALYLLCLGQLNRASKFSSMALHSALSLGINLRNTDGRIHDGAKEARSRLWWSIYSLEHLLTSMHGRASCVGENLCSVPLPIPAEEENFNNPEILQLLQNTPIRESKLKAALFETQAQRREPPSWIVSCDPSPSLFFHYLVDLTLISQAVLNKVYSIEGIREGISQTEYRIQSYSRSLDRWKSKLKPGYQFTLPGAGPWHINPNLDDGSVPYTRERVCLAMNYYSARITLCRPCLTQSNTPSAEASPDHSNSKSAPEPSPRSKLRAEMATHCLQASCSLISILPDTPALPWLASSTPWWSVLHFLMQATTALLLGLSYCAFASPPLNASNTRPSFSSPHGPNVSNLNRPLLEADLNIAVAEIKKALRWIHTMASVDPAARRAFILCDSLLQRIAPGLGLDLADWPRAETLGGGNSQMDEKMRKFKLDELFDFEGGTDRSYFE